MNRSPDPRLLSVLFAGLAAASAGGQDFDAYHLFVASNGNDRILEYDREGALVREIGVGVGMTRPTSLAFGPAGRLYVTSSDKHRVFVFDGDGQVVGDFSADPGGAASLPAGLAFGPRGHLYVAGLLQQEIYVYDVRTLPPKLINEVDVAPIFPSDLEFGPHGNLYVCHASEGKVHELTPDLTLVRSLENAALAQPLDVAMGPFGEPWAVSGSGSGSVVRMDAAGDVLDSIDDAELDFATGIAFGPDGNVYVSSRDTDRVVIFNRNGQRIDVITEGIDNTMDVAFSPVRFEARISGRVIGPGSEFEKLSDEVVMSLMPGSCTVMIRLDDDDDLVDVLEQHTLVLHGYEHFDDIDDSKWLVDGLERPELGAARGSGRVDLKVKLQEDDAGFRVKKAKGGLARAVQGGTFVGKIKTKGELND